MHDLLVIGDLHLGRMPTRIPATLLGGATAPELSPRAALPALVALARAERVAAVVFTGDVIDADNQYFEALAPLRDAVAELVAAGIEVLATVGNHDAGVLPRVAATIPGLRLLAVDGRWETHVVRRDGAPLVRLVAWSFTAPRQLAPPLAALPATWRRRAFGDGLDVPIVGVAHGDLDVPGSPYAPFARAELAATGYDAWLLGHVHRPSNDLATATIGHVGAATAADPGEPGPHGPWLVAVGDGPARLRQVALSPVRYEAATAEIDGATTLEELEDALAAAALQAAGALADVLHPATLAVLLRLTCVGRLAPGLGPALAEAARRAVATVDMPAGGARVAIESVVDATTPAVDLVALAAARDPRGAIARLLLELAEEPPGREAASRIREARVQIDEVRRRRAFAALPVEQLDDAAVRELLVRAGRRALDALAATGPAA